MIEISGVKKSFGGVKALKSVDLQVRAGEIHAVLGENGAGKSTLMKIISGAISKDAGEIKLDGVPVNFTSTQSAKDKGIGIIYQEFSLVPELSVAENIFLDRLQDQFFINWKKLQRQSEELISSLGFHMDVKRKVKSLSIAQQQVVEIAKALSKNVKVLILDEPSAVLGPDDIKKLFSSLVTLKSKGVAIIYISHHLDEVFSITDRITVLKDGQSVGSLITKETNKDQLVNMMLGRSLGALFPDKKLAAATTGEKRIQIRDITLAPNQEGISFDLRPGEILGIGGLVGSGRTELLRAIFGADPNSGKVMVGGEGLDTESPRRAVISGIGMVPEDRKQHGGLMGLSIAENISLSSYGKVSNGLGMIDRKKETQIVEQLQKMLNIKMHSPQQALGMLSGGNQQKVILAKWLNTDVDLLLIDEPTRGVDIGAKAEIYELLRELSSKGLAILMVSSDWEELLGLPDRVLIMRKAAVVGELEGEALTEETMLRMAIGQ